METVEPNQQEAGTVVVVAQQDAIELEWAQGGAVRIVQRDGTHNISAVVIIRPEFVDQFGTALDEFVA